MIYVLAFLAILGPLVVVHELGHLVLAKIFNVKAEAFSIGFGPILLRKMWGETEFRFSVIPLGGYVKLLGEEPGVELPPEMTKRALCNAARWKKFFIFFAGPFFNFLFAIIVFMTILVIGEEQLASVVGRVERGSYAEKIGFKSGDKVVAINGRNVSYFNDIIMNIHQNPGKTLGFTVVRANESKQIELKVPVQSIDGYSMYGEAKDVGKIDGLLAVERATNVGISDPASPAGKAGLKTGDKILSINGNNLKKWSDLEDAYNVIPVGNTVELAVQKDDKTTVQVGFVKSSANKNMEEAWGLHSTELFIETVVPDSPAKSIGIQRSDRIVKIGDKEIFSYPGLKDAIQKMAFEKGEITVTWERDGKMHSSNVVPTATEGRDPALKRITEYTIGVNSMMTLAEPITIIERVWNPIMLIYRGVEKMSVMTWMNFVVIWKMITGSVSMSTVGGPILIGKLAGDSLEKGLVSFLSMMAMLSVALGIMNLMPIPVLDGGHLMILGIEIIRGKPLSLRQMEILQQVGLSLILLLMVVVMRNDLARLAIFH